VNIMDSTSWENIKSKYKVGQFVLGKVEFHTPFGVFVNIDESLVKELIKIPDFFRSRRHESRNCYNYRRGCGWI
jgi:ribosomal protein S1